MWLEQKGVNLLTISRFPWEKIYFGIYYYDIHIVEYDIIKNVKTCSKYLLRVCCNCKSHQKTIISVYSTSDRLQLVVYQKLIYNKFAVQWHLTLMVRKWIPLKEIVGVILVGKTDSASNAAPIIRIYVLPAYRTIKSGQVVLTEWVTFSSPCP